MSSCCNRSCTTTLHGGNALLNGPFEGHFAIHSVKSGTVPVVFVAENSIDELCDPGCPKGVLLGINLPLLLVMVRHECCFAVENIGRLVQYCHAERYHH